MFFCGAGISYPAGLPGFGGLVDQLYSGVGVTPNAVQSAAIKANQFDTAIGLLENDVVGSRERVRRELARILTPSLGKPGATATHEALLTLGRNRKNCTRIVTTNFDRLFEEVINAKSLALNRFHAPLLPVPKNRWDGLVYLHGLLSATPVTSDLNHLVVSSGDFGLAYLTERWAARFVGELFRNYTVCFVGYSISDPVLRYMTDALAADRQLGESSAEMFAFGSYSKGQEQDRANEWRAKNVTPILYREYRRHAYLHRTLRAWAETYRDGVRGKERIVVDTALARPLASTRQDDFVGRMLWALSDSNGLPAKRFAEHDPVPSLDWLEPLSEDRYRHADLSRFGVAPHASEDADLAFSMLRRPASYRHAPWMTVTHPGGYAGKWDSVMRQLARWLLRHLGDPKLLLWLAKRGERLHDELARLIEHRLDELDNLERGGDTGAQQRIRDSAPNAIPTTSLRTLWRILLTGRIKLHASGFDLYRWKDRHDREGLTPALRMQLREILTPRVLLREPFRWPSETDPETRPERVRDLAEWEIVLTADHAHTLLRDFSNSQPWRTGLPDLLPDFSGLLRDALDLMRELGGATDKSDLTYIHHPSISKHRQNRYHRQWTALIDLTRDAWLATASRSPQQALRMAETWWDTPYPLFRRLAFFAAAQDAVIPHRRALDWLVSEERWWLWSSETQRESMRLLAALCPALERPLLQELEQAILLGPIRAMYKEDLDPDRWSDMVDLGIWLRLMTMQQAGATLGDDARARLDMLSAQHPDWTLEQDESDEFPFWMGGGRSFRKPLLTPRRRRDLIEWLKQHPTHGDFDDDDWRERCSNSFATTSYALYALSREGIWPNDRWQEALQAWSEEKHQKQSWRYMAPVVAALPDATLNAIEDAIGQWLQSVARTFDQHEDCFFSLARRILAMGRPSNSESEQSEEFVTQAINHPVGHVTEALLQWWYRRSLDDGQGLPSEIKTIFTALCDPQTVGFRHGRVLLAAHAITLFRVDREWAENHLLPLFDWQSSEVEARATWEGFLWSPRLYRPLFEAFKRSFLDTAKHHDALGKYDNQYASLLTFAALDPGDTFTISELKVATADLPANGLNEAAHALTRALDGAGDQRAELWKNQVKPYIERIWPSTRDKATPEIAEAFGRLCIAAGDAFPDALNIVRHWLGNPRNCEFLVDELKQSNLCTRFPIESLFFLDIIITDNTLLFQQCLGDCLRAIRGAMPLLQTDPRFIRLADYLRRYGQEL